MCGTGRTARRFPAGARRVIATLSRVLQSPGLAHPIGQLDVQTTTFCPSVPKTSMFFFAFRRNELSADPPGRSRSLRSVDPSDLGAYLPQEFLGNHYAYSSLGFRREFYRLPQFVGRKDLLGRMV